MPLATTGMKLEIIIISEVNQEEKDKYHMISLVCIIVIKIVELIKPDSKTVATRG